MALRNMEHFAPTQRKVFGGMETAKYEIARNAEEHARIYMYSSGSDAHVFLRLGICLETAQYN